MRAVTGVLTLSAVALSACAPSTEPLNGRATIASGSKAERQLDTFYASYKTGPWECEDGRRIRYLTDSSITCAPDRP